MKKVLRLAGIGLFGLIIAISLGGCGRSWWCKGDMSDHFMKKLDSEVKDLKLTQEQQLKYEDIRSRLESDLKKHMDRMKELHSEIEINLEKERPDVSAMAAQLKKRFTEEGDPRLKLVDYFVEFYNILDQDQQKKLLDHIRSKQGKCFNWHS